MYIAQLQPVTFDRDSCNMNDEIVMPFNFEHNIKSINHVWRQDDGSYENIRFHLKHHT